MSDKVSIRKSLRALYKKYKGITLQDSPSLVQAEVVMCRKCKFFNYYYNASFLLDDKEFLKVVEGNFKHFKRTHKHGKSERYE